jgi:hypothetical protein
MPTMENFVQWISDHPEIALLIIVSVFAVGYIIAHRKSLFYKE